MQGSPRTVGFWKETNFKKRGGGKMVGVQDTALG